MANSLTKIKTNAIDDDAVTLAKQAAGTDGQIITYDASGNPTAVGPGTDGQVLTSTGAGSPPAFEAIPAGVGGATGVDFNDSVKARFGTGNDLEIYHNGSNSVIKDSGTGNLNINTSRFQVTNAADDESIINAVEDGAVELFYNNTKVFQTNGTDSVASMQFVPMSDNSYPLGASDARWTHAYLSGNLYLGGTGSANALSDYEEGTWTPAGVNDTTLSSAIGSYTKIGRMVFVYFNFQINQINSGSTNKIAGLPFACSPNQAFGQHGYFANLISVNRSIVPYAGNTTEIYFHTINNSDAFSLNTGIFGDGARIDGSIVYQTNA